MIPWSSLQQESTVTIWTKHRTMVQVSADEIQIAAARVPYVSAAMATTSPTGVVIMATVMMMKHGDVVSYEQRTGADQ